MRNFYHIIFFLIAIGSYAQLQTAHWYFGGNAGVDFTSGSPVALTNGQINTNEGSAVMSDDSGNLLFYTDGTRVYNKNHTVMLNGAGLLGQGSSSQSALIVSKPENPGIYYIFTIWGESGLRYSVVDMSLDGGNGAITEKNVLLLSLTGPGGSEKFTAANMANCSGYWITTHFVGSFYSFSITSEGVNTQPVISTVGIQSYYAIQGAGYMKLSPNGKKLAVAHRDIYVMPTGALGLYDFDNATGTVSNEILLHTPTPNGTKKGFYGVEFSPDNNVLYATYGDNYTNCLVQYDLTANDIPSSEYLMDSWISVVSGALQLGLDNKIYHTRGSEYLSVINNPNEAYNPDAGTAPYYTVQGVYLAGADSTHGLPNFMNSLFYSTILINGVENQGEYCQQELSFSYCHNGGEVAGILWDFGDGTTSTEENPVHTYEPETYTITLQLTIGHNTYTMQEEITIHPLPDVQDAELARCISEGEEAGFDLTESYPQINPNAEDVTFSFHLTEQEAEDNENSQPTIYTTSSTTTLWVRVENEWGCVTIIQLELIVNLLPTFTVETPIEICTGSTAELEVTTATTNTVNWYDSATSTTPIFTGNPFTTPNLTATTSYWVEVESAEGCVSERQEIVVEVADEITPLFTQIEPICFGEEFNLPDESINGIIGTWTPAVDNTQTTTYTFHPDPDQCAAEDYTMTVEVVAIPELELPDPIEICSGETITITVTTTGETVHWYVNETETTPIHTGISYTIQPTQTTTYWVEAQTGECKSERILFTVTVNPLSTIEAEEANPVCEGNPAELSVITNGQTVNWYDSPTSTTPIFTGNPFVTPNLNQTTIYWAEAISSENCTGERIAVTAVMTDEITPEFDFQTQYCLNSEEIILPTTSDNSVTGTWAPSTINTSILGTAFYTFIPDLECAETIQIPVTIVEIIVPEFELIQNYCLGATPDLLPNVSDNLIAGTWFPNEINAHIQGTTVYTFTPNEGQCSEEYLHTITVYPHPEMELEEKIVICEGDSYTYTAPDGFDSYEWKNQQGQVISTEQSVNFTQEGIYTLTVEINGVPCQLSRNIEVTFSDPPTIIEIKTTENTLTVYAQGGMPMEYSLNQVFWQSSPIFTNLQPGIFNVFVRDAKGCSTTAKQIGILGVPNFISPNGDGYNDTWKIRALEAYPNTRLQIFDRYGKMFVDRILDGDFKWDGKYNSQPLPSGTYWYILYLENGEKISGHINLRNRD